MNKSLKKELLLYVCIMVILIIVSVLNNKYWKLGKMKIINKMDSSNVIYNVPFEEQWLD